eukprot:GHUV01015376.1.p1 GENE.GHUV01015376.1~~GHUV01015376.1.p1  ORF type:complete len:684 (+),score=141.22 GHUV01015376.1:514-2565(+)
MALPKQFHRAHRRYLTLNGATALSVLQLGRAADAATKAAVLWVFKRLTLDYAQEALHRGHFPMQYKVGKAAEPVLQRLLAAALWCNSQELIEAAAFLGILDDLQEVCTVEHCMDIITWLENNMTVLASPPIADAPFGVNSFTRVCNGILKRLGKHEVISKARLLMLIASITPLFDRSGLGITAQLAPPDPPIPETVPENAVDSTGKPVDVLLYKHFWSLQAILQNPLAALNSLDTWQAFRKELTVVLENLARTPATVNAARAVSSEAQLDNESTNDEGAGTQCYLSSYKLFGLQLTDSAFRRDFLVQVLIMLRTLLIPGKVPADTLKPKQRMEAVELEKQVYKVLETTPRSGKEFCRAIKEVLERETTWVAWKKGGPAFVVPGKEQEAPEPAAPGSKRAPQQPPQTCIEWNKPPVPSLTAAVAKANAETERQQRKRKLELEEGWNMKRESDHSGRMYDNLGEPPDTGLGKRALKLLGTSSGIMFWAQARVADRSLNTRLLLAGMKVTEQQYPTPDAVAAQAMREMDPDAVIEPGYRRVKEDPVYRWRVGRIAAHGLTEWDGEDPKKVEDAVKDVLADKLPPNLKAQVEREKAMKAASSRATAGGRPGHPGVGAGHSAPAAAAAHKEAAGDEQGRSAAGAQTPAASDGGGGEDDAAGADAAETAVKAEPGEAGGDGMDVDTAAQ